jgi:hypothetical protein
MTCPTVQLSCCTRSKRLFVMVATKCGQYPSRLVISAVKPLQSSLVPLLLLPPLLVHCSLISLTHVKLASSKNGCNCRWHQQP